MDRKLEETSVNVYRTRSPIYVLYVGQQTVECLASSLNIKGSEQIVVMQTTCKDEYLDLWEERKMQVEKSVQ
jgi:hypothetical protein